MRALIAFLLLFPTLALSQGAATLVADNITVLGGNRLVATGNIEVFYDGTRLSAAQVIYDQATDQMTILGPMFIVASDGTLLTADRATLDPKLENGMLRGARLVLDQQLQLAANQIDRVDGRYSQLYKVAATSCQICGTRPPLWEIRAQKVVHDQEKQQLYFTNAHFLVRGVPIFWLPRLRLPDPTLKRTTGLLIPRLRTTSQLGTGIALPYFITLGDHRDITVTPYLSAKTRTFEVIYRQAFVAGNVTVNAAVSQDKLQDEQRAYLFASGAFDLQRDYQLQFDIEATTDTAYLLEYGYSGKDRLDSAVSLLRVRDTDLTQLGLTYYQTLREDETAATLPSFIGHASYENRVPLGYGNTFYYAASADAAYRYATRDGVAGRDVTRFGIKTGVARDMVTQRGLVLRGIAGVHADAFGVFDDPAFDDATLRVSRQFGLTLRYPMAKTTRTGALHLLEPTIALAWADAYGKSVPNEDSTRSEFDQANLFNAQRFSGEDVVETGAQAAIGATWTRLGAQGNTSTLTFGRILRDTHIAAFNPSSGLDGRSSDWLLAGQYMVQPGFRLDGRTLFDGNAEVTRAAARIGWQFDTVDMSAAYIWQAPDTTESRPDAVSEWTLDTKIALTPAWAVNIGTRYDLANTQPANANLAIQYRNECARVDFSASRRYASSLTVEPSTSYGLSITLDGFSAGQGSAGPRAACTK